MWILFFLIIICVLFHHDNYYYWDIYVHCHSFGTKDLRFRNNVTKDVQLLISGKVSALGPSLRTLDCICYHKIP